MKVPKDKKMQIVFSILFLTLFFFLIGVILFIEVSDTLNMRKGENSMMGEVTLLIGVITGGMSQILNFWFDKSKQEDEEDEDELPQ